MSKKALTHLLAANLTFLLLSHALILLYLNCDLLSVKKKFQIYISSVTIRNNRKKGKKKSKECHNHKPQPFPDLKRKRKPTNPNKHKPNKRTKSTKIC